MLPSPTPATSRTTVGPERSCDATVAAAKTPIQSAIVSGFEAVAPSDVTNAHRGVATSVSFSAPARTRNELQKLRKPRKMSTAAPTTPSAVPTLAMVSADEAPAAPAAA